MFKAFHREGLLHVQFRGRRYEKLLEIFGGDPTPAAEFGFGDAVIVELLKQRDILPSFEGSRFNTLSLP